MNVTGGFLFQSGAGVGDQD